MTHTVSETVSLLTQLIAYPTVSSTSNIAITDFLAEQLRFLGFEIEITRYSDHDGVEKANVLAKRFPKSKHGVNEAGGIAYFSHSDVVPVDDWQGPGGNPFSATIENNRVYGRGSCDMKGSIAAFLSAVTKVSVEFQTKPIWFVCTADEEVGFNGAKHLVRESAGYRELVAAQPVSIIGEPTEMGVVHAHKGIVVFTVTSRGRAAHSSTADGINANVALVPVLQKILEIYERTISDTRYHDDRFDPPTLSWNFGFSDHNNANNVTAPRSDAWVCLRTMPTIDGEDLISEVKQLAESLGLEFSRKEGGEPIWIDIDASCIRTVCEISGSQPRTKCYSTDGGQFVDLAQRLVWGPGDIRQAHTNREWIDLDQLIRGTELYRQTIERYCR